ncbi:amidohydrolase family protein [Pseudoalteromonas sp. H105]|uniref:amidohydrolase family protein n=1 Tax=Pseudoalteromonas sp. H105 TaxID=1348393 RepID=UPI0007322A0F|nr:amidohydrolase family protein [Pseudoalteromonas sp. H105]KTF10032.1 hypothetical protein ATS75_19415 [Pseudoalteromonas sp. H105]
MKVFLKILAVLFGLLLIVMMLKSCAVLDLPLAEPLKQKQPTANILIKNVSVVDAPTQSVVPHKNVLIKDGFIVAITDANANVDSPIDTHIVSVDGTDKYLMPSLWDMHSHLAFDLAPLLAMPMYLAHGVTNLRDMQGVMIINAHRRKWKASIDNGELLGPKIIGFAGEIVGDSYDERDVEAVVERTSDLPDSFVKIYSGILPDRYFKLAEAARLKGVSFAGHYPLVIDPVLASKAGQKSFEHAHLLIDSSSTRADDLRAYYLEYYTSDDGLTRKRPTKTEMIDSFSKQKFDNLVVEMVKNGTYFTPTHGTKFYEASVFDEFYLNDGKKDYVPFLLEYMWQDDTDGMRGQDLEMLQRYYQQGLKLTGLAHEQGVKILTGTDTFDPYSVPGLSLHEEMKHLVAAGLSTGESIVAATLNPALYFGLEKTHGTVEKGKVADMLLLNNNPLENIEHTKDIHALLFNGAIYHRDELSLYKEYVKDNVSGLSGAAMSLKMFIGLIRDNNPEARHNAHKQTIE